MTERFSVLAKAVARGRAMPNHPMLVIPGNPEFYASEEELATTIAGLIDDLVRLLAPGANS